MDIIKRLQSKFISYEFTDKVNGKAVNLYERKEGTKFLAHSIFGSIFFYIDCE